MPVYQYAELRFGDTGWDGLQTVNVRDGIAKWKVLTGKALYGYNGWIADWPGEFNWALQAGDHSVLPLLQDGTIKSFCVTWFPRLNGSSTDTATLKNIVNGSQDAYINRCAVYCKDFPYPILIRFGGEMNINQGAATWEGTWASIPADFVAAWKRIVDIFDAVGTPNVQWVWNPNYAEASQLAHHWTEYYPGDNYVDWVGIDMYQSDDNVDPNQQMAGIYNDYNAKKPIGIFEWGVNSQDWSGTATTDAKRAEYMEKFFNAVESRPNVKLIAYWYLYNFKFDATTLPLTTAKYKSRIANPLYVSGDNIVVAHTVQAVFVEIPQDNLIVVAPSGNGTTSPATGSYLHPAGSQVTLTATPASGSKLDYWVIDGVKQTANPFILTI